MNRYSSVTLLLLLSAICCHSLAAQGLSYFGHGSIYEGVDLFKKAHQVAYDDRLIEALASCKRAYSSGNIGIYLKSDSKEGDRIRTIYIENMGSFSEVGLDRYAQIEVSEQPCWNGVRLLLIAVRLEFGRGTAGVHFAFKALMGFDATSFFQVVSVPTELTTEEFSYYGDFKLFEGNDRIYAYYCYQGLERKSVRVYDIAGIVAEKDINKSNTFEEDFSITKVNTEGSIVEAFYSLNEMGINLREEPSLDSTVESVLKGDELFKVLAIDPKETAVNGAQGHWVNVEVHSVGTGWIWSSFIRSRG